MRAFTVAMLLFVFVCSSALVIAETNKDVPPWMENIDESGRSNYLVPKGAKRQVVGSQVLVEAPNEYAARRIYEMENYLERRFSEIEEEQKKLRDELKALKESLEVLGDSSKVIQDVDHLADELGRLETRIMDFETVLQGPKEPVAAENDLIEVEDEGVEVIGEVIDQQEEKILEK